MSELEDDGTSVNQIFGEDDVVRVATGVAVRVGVGAVVLIVVFVVVGATVVVVARTVVGTGLVGEVFTAVGDTVGDGVTIGVDGAGVAVVVCPPAGVAALVGDTAVPAGSTVMTGAVVSLVLSPPV